MSYKLVVLDMDGTLLTNDHSVSDKNKESIHSFKKKGIDFILASGRPFESILPYVRDLKLTLPVIAANGAVIKCPITEKLHFTSFLPLELSREIIEFGRSENYSISLYGENEVLTFDEKMVKLHWNLEKVNATLIDSFVGEKSLTKLIFSDLPKRINGAFEHLAKKYENELYITRSDDIFLDVMNLEVSKGKALRYIMDMLDLAPYEVMVMGNSFNDLTMFENAGLAIAMANSPQAVKEAAHFVTKSNLEDGVSFALEKII
ncbi:Cof subfamily protein (haloacid dehalogenase superfamily) [Evansella vedderi]|uniref:Cof subfamily protein (Haloacid dehalogenase superfamily) n=1 Tax=Evansella vedderi TaxID=38282 RepID=A0ABT9ZNN3_9BACI|nr:Cof-type HAD-IIB family hydrolase [Evansella vedderi]MDQ0252832.1 Cof subfamily protein (haloacid dehalogenase superfamily) [Evansella vedderi]